MNYLLRAFKKEQYRFGSALSAAALAGRMREVCGRGIWDFSVNLDGDAFDDGSFRFTKKWSFARGGTRNAYIVARVLPAAKGSVVDVTVGASWGLIVPAAFGFAVGLFMLVNWFIHSETNTDNLTIALVFMFAVPVLAAGLGNYAKTMLLDTFKTTFDLKPGPVYLD